jgi:hypothetical protein
MDAFRCHKEQERQAARKREVERQQRHIEERSEAAMQIEECQAESSSFEPMQQRVTRSLSAATAAPLSSEQQNSSSSTLLVVGAPTSSFRAKGIVRVSSKSKGVQPASRSPPMISYNQSVNPERAAKATPTSAVVKRAAPTAAGGLDPMLLAPPASPPAASLPSVSIHSAAVQQSVPPAVAHVTSPMKRKHGGSTKSKFDTAEGRPSKKKHKPARSRSEQIAAAAAAADFQFEARAPPPPDVAAVVSAAAAVSKPPQSAFSAMYHANPSAEPNSTPNSTAQRNIGRSLAAADTPAQNSATNATLPSKSTVPEIIAPASASQAISSPASADNSTASGSSDSLSSEAPAPSGAGTASLFAPITASDAAVDAQSSAIEKAFAAASMTSPEEAFLWLACIRKYGDDFCHHMNEIYPERTPTLSGQLLRSRLIWLMQNWCCERTSLGSKVSEDKARRDSEVKLVADSLLNVVSDFHPQWSGGYVYPKFQLRFHWQQQGAGKVRDDQGEQKFAAIGRKLLNSLSCMCSMFCSPSVHQREGQGALLK